MTGSAFLLLAAASVLVGMASAAYAKPTAKRVRARADDVRRPGILR
jgi:hypothetical protein